MTLLDDPELEIWESHTGITHLVFEQRSVTLCGKPIRGAEGPQMYLVGGLSEYASCRKCSGRYLKLVGDL